MRVKMSAAVTSRHFRPLGKNVGLVVTTVSTLSSLGQTFCSAFPLPTVPSDIPEAEGVLQGDVKYPKISGYNGVRLQLWPQAIIPYGIDPSLFQFSGLITQAMRQIESQTCVKFKIVTNERDFVYFTSDLKNGCWSWVGKIGGRQNVNLNSQWGCLNHGVIIHEILHALGMFHEQSRPDRDTYVQINWNNIIPQARQNFNMESAGSWNQDPYDYTSVMHYGAYEFAWNQLQPTIIARTYGAQIGQRNGLSNGDINKIKRLYSCP